jgi:hypothetical protein
VPPTEKEAEKIIAELKNHTIDLKV